MSKRRSARISCFGLLLAVLCLSGLLAGGVWVSVPGRAERTFGPPASRLDGLQRVYLSARLLLQENDLVLPHDISGADRSFQVQVGEGASSIATRLEAEGVIVNSGALLDYLIYAGLDTSLQAGDYRLSPRMTAIEIARAMQDAAPSEVTFRILPGWRLDEIAAAMPTSGFAITPEVFQQAAAARPAGYTFLDELPEGATLEGFLFPEKYRLPRSLTADELIRTFLDNFQAQVGDDAGEVHQLRQGFEQQGLDLFQAVTLASIIQREAMVEDEMPLIASVFLNRLAAGMKLESDPTVQYALGYNQDHKTWWTNPLSASDLHVDSQYNTYLFPGLPPGPISNPGLAALWAVAFPAQSNYYYFRAACDGSGRHNFAQTYNGHVKNACP